MPCVNSVFFFVFFFYWPFGFLFRWIETSLYKEGRHRQASPLKYFHCWSKTDLSSSWMSPLGQGKGQKLLWTKKRYSLNCLCLSDERCSPVPIFHMTVRTKFKRIDNVTNSPHPSPRSILLQNEANIQTHKHSNTPYWLRRTSGGGVVCFVRWNVCWKVTDPLIFLVESLAGCYILCTALAHD